MKNTAGVQDFAATPWLFAGKLQASKILREIMSRNMSFSSLNVKIFSYLCRDYYLRVIFYDYGKKTKS